MKSSLIKTTFIYKRISFADWYDSCLQAFPSLILFKFTNVDWFIARTPELAQHVPDGFYFVLLVSNKLLLQVVTCSNIQQVYSAANNMLPSPVPDLSIVLMGHAHVNNIDIEHFRTEQFWNLINQWFFLDPFYIHAIEPSSDWFPAPMRFIQYDMPREPAMPHMVDDQHIHNFHCYAAVTPHANYQYIFAHAAYASVNAKLGQFNPNISVLNISILTRLKQDLGEQCDLANIISSPTNWAINCSGDLFDANSNTDFVSTLNTKMRVIHQFGVFCINRNQVLVSAFLIWWARDGDGKINVNDVISYSNVDCVNLFNAVSSIFNVHFNFSNLEAPQSQFNASNILNHAEAAVFACLTNKNVKPDTPAYDSIKPLKLKGPNHLQHLTHIQQLLSMLVLLSRHYRGHEVYFKYTVFSDQIGQVIPDEVSGLVLVLNVYTRELIFWEVVSSSIPQRIRNVLSGILNRKLDITQYSVLIILRANHASSDAAMEVLETFGYRLAK